jgi:hypothetical protein
MSDGSKTALATLAAFGVAGAIVMLVIPIARSDYEAEQIKLRATDAEKSTRIWQRIQGNEQNSK